MRNLLLAVTLMTLVVSCGRREKVKYKTNTVTEVEEVEVSQLFEGSFYLENNGFIEMYQSGDNVYIDSRYQNLTTINPENNTFGELPKISGEYEIVDNKVRISKNLNYRDGNDIEEDVTGNNIRGNRRTDITIEFIDDIVNITYEIYSNRINDNINTIVAKRTLKGE